MKRQPGSGMPALALAALVMLSGGGGKPVQGVLPIAQAEAAFLHADTLTGDNGFKRASMLRTCTAGRTAYPIDPSPQDQGTH